MSRGAPENIKKEAFGALLLLKDHLPSNVKLAIGDEFEIVISALKRHDKHLSTHVVDQNHLDPFKLICWVGGAIIDRLDKDVSYHQHERILDSMISALEEILVSETNGEVRPSLTDGMLIKRLVLEEIKGNCDHGIGFNGLFIAFHCFRSAHKQIKGKK